MQTIGLAIGFTLLRPPILPMLNGMGIATKSIMIRATADARPSKVKSAVTNGKRLHVVPPGDTKWSRRFRDVLSEIISDIGGREGLSEGQRQLARRATTIAIACERMEGEAARGHEIDLEVFGTLTDRLGRCFHRLGLKRVAKNITPSVEEYVKHLNAKAAE